MAIPPPRPPVDLEHKHDDSMVAQLGSFQDPAVANELHALRVAAEEMPPERKQKEEKHEEAQPMEGIISYNEAFYTDPDNKLHIIM